MLDINNKIAYITLFHGSDHIIEKPVFGEGKSQQVSTGNGWAECTQSQYTGVHHT